VSALIETVQRNQRTLRRFQDMELRLIGARDSATFFDSLLAHLPREFGLASVNLWLDDSTPLLGDLLITARLHTDVASNLKTGIEAGQAIAELCDHRRPWLGRGVDMTQAAREALFGEDTPPASAIVLPLSTDEQLVGYLCLGSDDVTRFEKNLATDFLERFASIIAVSVDNVAHREQLRQLGMTDPLTGLSNRRCFDERLQQEVRRATSYATSVSCLFIDIDHFNASMTAMAMRSAIGLWPSSAPVCGNMCVSAIPYRALVGRSLLPCCYVMCPSRWPLPSGYAKPLPSPSCMTTVGSGLR